MGKSYPNYKFKRKIGNSLTRIETSTEDPEYILVSGHIFRTEGIRAITLEQDGLCFHYPYSQQIHIAVFPENRDKLIDELKAALKVFEAEIITDFDLKKFKL